MNNPILAGILIMLLLVSCTPSVKTTPIPQHAQPNPCGVQGLPPDNETVCGQIKDGYCIAKVDF